MRSFVLRWTLFSFWGWFIGFVIMLALAASLDKFGYDGFQVIVGLGMGLGVGLMQGRLLSGYATAKRHWWWVTMVGMGLTFLMWDIVGFSKDGQLIDGSLELTTLVGGFVVGAAQMILLKGNLNKAVVWIPASTVGWGLAGYLASMIELLPKSPPLLGFFLAIGVILGGGIVLGLVTGIVLNALTRITGKSK